MNLRLLVREIVRVALQLKRGTSADNERVIEKSLKRDDDLPPRE
jgi:hypothetical protein